MSTVESKIAAVITPEELLAHWNGHRGLTSKLIEAFPEKEFLTIWDENTTELFENLAKIPLDKFHERILSFGQYEGTIWGNIYYFLDNEIHHRAQGYVYLRSMGVEPPAFWDR